MTKLKPIFLAILLVLLWSACSSDGSHNKKSVVGIDNLNSVVKKAIEIDAPLSSASYIVGEEVPIKIKKTQAGPDFDSVQLFVNDNRMVSATERELNYKWLSRGASLGRNRIRVAAFSGGKILDTGNTSFILLSDIEPETRHFKLIKKYPHDSHAYTQGLCFENGILYESTGQYSQSTLRKVNLQTGEVIQSVNLPGDIFGEGLTLYGNNLVQITWKSEIGFVYDKKTFQQLNKVYYQKQGWGITYDGKKLIMSDGSEILTFYDTEYFTELGHIEVCDNKEAIKWLNELEYIKGEIYANIYQETRIAVIEPATGKVKAYLDLAALVPEDLKKDSDKVLNGIAWNPSNGHLYVTGKYWPVLYEIEIY